VCVCVCVCVCYKRVQTTDACGAHSAVHTCNLQLKVRAHTAQRRLRRTHAQTTLPLSWPKKGNSGKGKMEYKKLGSPQPAARPVPWATHAQLLLGIPLRHRPHLAWAHRCLQVKECGWFRPSGMCQADRCVTARIWDGLIAACK